MKNATVTTISRADFFESSVKPDLEEILSFCREHRIPFFYTACVENSAEKGSVYVWNAVTPDSLGLSLRDDRIQKHICVANGDEAVPSIGEDVEMGLKEEPFITKETETEEFDKKSCFEKEVHDRLRSLTATCGIYKIPFFYTACVANTKNNGTEYVSGVVGPYGRELVLVDDRIARHIDVLLGFEIIHVRGDIGGNVMDLVDGDELEGLLDTLPDDGLFSGADDGTEEEF